MEFIDTHAHLDFKYDNSIETIIEEAKAEKVNNIITISSSVESLENAYKISNGYENIYYSLGIHPHDAKYFTKEIEEKIKKLKNNKCVAIGEIGLDYFYNHSEKNTQKKVFVKQIEIAKELKLPIILHSRDADTDTYEILKSEETSGVLHCYTSTKEILKKYLDLGLYVSFTGVITFKKTEHIKEALKYAPKDRVMIETDSPFLAPNPYRGKTNLPKYIPIIADEFSKIRRETLQEVASYTTRNAKTLFNIF